MPSFLRNRKSPRSPFVQRGEDILKRCSHDETLDLDPVLPREVCQPKNTREVQKAVLYAAQNGLAVTARGAGTGKAGGCVPSKNSLVIDFSKMNQILEMSTENLTATVEPGVILQDFKTVAEAKNLFYPYRGSG